MNHRITINPDGVVESTPGVEYGGTMTIVWIDTQRTRMVAHRTGTHYWSGLGQPQSYSPARFIVFRIVDYHGDGTFTVEPDGGWDAAANQRAVAGRKAATRIWA